MPDDCSCDDRERGLVSVIIPVFNCERYLRESIVSVLEQQYAPVETIVVDDGSTDGSARVAQSLGDRVQYHVQPHEGAAAARNRGVRSSRGEFIAFLDADDLWVKDKLERQVEVLERDEQIDMVFGHVRQFISPDLASERGGELRHSQEIMPGYVLSAMLIRREAFFQVGPFETIWSVGEFLSWYSRAMELGLRSEMLAQVVAHRRIHASNQGVYKRQSRGDFVKILKAALDRKRERVSSTEGRGHRTIVR